MFRRQTVDVMEVRLRVLTLMLQSAFISNSIRDINGGSIGTNELPTAAALSIAAAAVARAAAFATTATETKTSATATKPKILYNIQT